MTQLFGYI